MQKEVVMMQRKLIRETFEKQKRSLEQELQKSETFELNKQRIMNADSIARLQTINLREFKS